MMVAIAKSAATNRSRSSASPRGCRDADYPAHQSAIRLLIFRPAGVVVATASSPLTIAAKVKKQDHRTCRPAPGCGPRRALHVIQEAADRQPRRDRHPHRARRGRRRHRDGRDPSGGRCAVAARARGRRGGRNSRPRRAGLSRHRGRGGGGARPPAATPCIPATASSARTRRSPRPAPMRASIFVGPKPAALELFGDKVAARQLAKRCGVPVIAGTSGPSTLRGDRGVLHLARQQRGDHDQGDGRRRRARHARGARARRARRGLCALPVRGQGGVRLRRRLCRAADPAGAPHRGADRRRPARRDLPSLGTRMHHPAPPPEADRGGAEPGAERRPCAAASSRRRDSSRRPRPTTTSARSSSWSTATAEDSFAFIEANPRLQVEHTVTEEVLGLDLVRAQLAVAAGSSLASLGLAQSAIPKPRGYAMQLRVNMETLDETGATHPTGGVLAVFEPPSGPGVRVDSFGYAGYRTSAAFDSLLAKVIVQRRVKPGTDVVAKASRALARVPDRRRRHQHRLPPGRARASRFQDQSHCDRLHRSQYRQARGGGGWRGQAALLRRDRAKRRALPPRRTSRSRCPKVR